LSFAGELFGASDLIWSELDNQLENAVGVQKEVLENWYNTAKNENVNRNWTARAPASLPA
jgi:hypothetical protein